MVSDFDPIEEQVDLSTDMQQGDFSLTHELPAYLDFLPDGRDTIIIARPISDHRNLYVKGSNFLGFQETSSLAACSDLMNQFKHEVTEDKIVRHSIDWNICHITEDPQYSGGISFVDQAQLLTQFDVPAYLETACTLEQIADQVEIGRGVIIEVNAGIIYDNANLFEQGNPNHLVVIIGVARDPDTGDIQGFFISDITNEDLLESKKFIDAKTVRESCLQVGGNYIVTDSIR